MCRQHCPITMGYLHVGSGDRLIQNLTRFTLCQPSSASPRRQRILIFLTVQSTVTVRKGSLLLHSQGWQCKPISSAHIPKQRCDSEYHPNTLTIFLLHAPTCFHDFLSLLKTAINIGIRKNMYGTWIDFYWVRGDPCASHFSKVL